jgi:hypothetical protein
MNYASIDSTIRNFARKHSLLISTVYKDAEVRSIEMVNSSGKRCQIWIDPPNSGGGVGVHAWDYKKMRKDNIVPASVLSECLEDVYMWCQSL